MKVGDKVKISGHKKPWTVKALSERYAILTTPFNPKRTVLYTIIDFKYRVRNRNNLVFNIYDYKAQEDIDQCLKDLESGEVELSKRGLVKLEDHITRN
jgi:hypothetical protein